MLRSLRLSLLPVLAVLALCPGVPSAFAAESPWKSVDVILHDDPSGPILLVAGELADKVTLPAEVVLAAPTGLKLEWAGEVLGGPVEQDPSVTPQMSPSGGVDAYSFSMYSRAMCRSSSAFWLQRSAMLSRRSMMALSW